MSTDTTQYRRSAAPVLAPVLVLLLLMCSGCSEKEATAPRDAAPVPASAPPAAEAEAPPAEASTPDSVPDEPQTASGADGQKIYQASCQACHAAGIAGAPKLGDKDAWAPRIAKGNDALFASVKNGLKAMPPKGTCMACSDDELRAAVEYMVGQGT